MTQENNDKIKDNAAEQAPASQQASAATQADTPTRRPVAESQHQRWLIYGANVALVTLLVVALVVFAIWLSGRHNARLNTASTGVPSLRPQTKNILADLKYPVTIVSLYPKLKTESGKPDFYQPVADLLDEYGRNSRKIKVEMIDPVADPDRMAGWIREMTLKYGGDIKPYKEAIDRFKPVLGDLKKLSSEEAQLQSDMIKKLVEEREKKTEKDQSFSEDMIEKLNLAAVTVRYMPKVLDQTQAAVDEEMKQRIPDFNAAVSTMKSNLRQFSKLCEQVIKSFKELDAAKIPPQAAEYMKQAVPRFEKIKKQADDFIAKAENLPELKLDDLRRKLSAEEGQERPPAIAVMVDEPAAEGKEARKDIRLIDFDDVWKAGEPSSMIDPTAPPTLRFAGEQRVTGAIIALQETKKPKIAFIRPGGTALTGGGFGRGGPFSDLADRLRSYNFEIIEKDITGRSAMEAQMRGMPPQPEPGDEELKDAIWICFSYAPSFTMMGQQPMPNPLGEKLKAHLAAGGKALVLYSPQSDDLNVALKDWGIEVKTDMVIVHQPIVTKAASEDFVEEAQRQPLIFVVNHYGDHALTKPLETLDGVILPMVVVQKGTPAKGYRLTQILPVPQNVKIWGEKDVQAAMDGEPVEYNPDKGDVPAPLFAGAVSENDSGGRLVVIGSLQFATNNILNMPDVNLQRRSNIRVARFPGNAELLSNSIFWLAKQDRMMALSPAALEVNRIRPMGAGALGVWRYGVLLIGLPLLVLAAGVMVYIARLD